MKMGWFSENFFLNNSLATLIFLSFLILIRFISVRYIRNSNNPWTSEQRLRWTGYIRSSFVAFLLLGLLYIWGEQVHNLAVSVFAIAFAIVFSVKELCMSINGSVTRLRGNLYNLGDRIEINGIRGDVIDMNFLSTTLLETGPGECSHHHTGRIISFPNKMILEHFVINESFIDHFFMRHIQIPLRLDENWKEAKEILLAIAKEECAPYLEQARRRTKERARQRSIELPSGEPRITIEMREPERISLILRIITPMHLKGRLEQTILVRFLEKFYSDRRELVKAVDKVQDPNRFSESTSKTQ